MKTFIFEISGGNFCHLNFVILYAKYYFIFSTKGKNSRLSFELFKKQLKCYYDLEQINLSKRDKFVLFLYTKCKWRDVQLN